MNEEQKMGFGVRN